MRILFLTDGITPFVKGGMQRHSQLMIEHLALLGDQLTVFHFVPDGETVNNQIAFSEEAMKNIVLKRFRYRDNGIMIGHYVRAQKRMSVQYFRQMLEDKVLYDFIYCKGFMGWELLKKRDQYGIKTPVGVKFHGMNMFQKQPDIKGYFSKYLLRPTARWILEQSDYVFSYGGKISELISMHCNTPIIEIPAGIQKEWIASKPSVNSHPRKFVFVGRFDRVKGLPELYKALSIIEKESEDWEFHFIGPIPRENQVRNGNVTYHGAIYNTDVLRKLLTEMDILVTTSISEGMPNVVLEAMALGLAVIATDVGATSVMVEDTKNGILIRDAKPVLIAEAILKMLALSDTRLTEMKQESLTAVARFSWDQVAPLLRSKVNECILATT